MEILPPILIVLATGPIIVSRSRTYAAVSVGSIYGLAGLMLWAGIGMMAALGYVVTGIAVGAIIRLSASRVVQMAPPVPRELNYDAVRVDAGLLPGRPRDGLQAAGSPPLGWFFILTTLLFCLVVAQGLSSTYPLSQSRFASAWESFVAYWLVIAGSLAACLTRGPLRSGAGLLLILCGTGISYILVVGGIRLTNVMGILLIAVLLALVTGLVPGRRAELAAPQTGAE